MEVNTNVTQAQAITDTASTAANDTSSQQVRGKSIENGRSLFNVLSSDVTVLMPRQSWFQPYLPNTKPKSHPSNQNVQLQREFLKIYKLPSVLQIPNLGYTERHVLCL